MLLNNAVAGRCWNLESDAEFHIGGVLEVRSMDWIRVEGNWKQVKGKVKEKWGQLTDDDLTAINGNALRNKKASRSPRLPALDPA